MAAVATDYTSNENFDLQPFYTAGSTEVYKWLHRTRGVNISVSSYIEDPSTTVENDNSYIVQGSSASGIAGTNLYQLQAQIVSVADGKVVESFHVNGMKFSG